MIVEVNEGGLLTKFHYHWKRSVEPWIETGIRPWERESSYGTSSARPLSDICTPQDSSAKVQIILILRAQRWSGCQEEPVEPSCLCPKELLQSSQGFEVPPYTNTNTVLYSMELPRIVDGRSAWGGPPHLAGSSILAWLSLGGIRMVLRVLALHCNPPPRAIFMWKIRRPQNGSMRKWTSLRLSLPKLSSCLRIYRLWKFKIVSPRFWLSNTQTTTPSSRERKKGGKGEKLGGLWIY